MNRLCIIVNIFCVVVVIHSAENRNNDYQLRSKSKEIELNEENDLVENLNFQDQHVNSDKSLSENVTLKNRDAESMTNTELITRGQIVSAISRAEVNGKQGILEDIYRLLDNQYSIGQSRKQGISVDLAPKTKLTATPGTEHVLVFVVSNYLDNAYFHTVEISTSLSYRPSFPSPLLIGAGQSVELSAQFWIPQDVVIKNNIIDTVTFSVQRPYDRVEVQTSAHIYSQNVLTLANKRTEPTIDYEFYDNCNGKLKSERCMFSRWSVKITVTNNESGLGYKGITSEPNGIRPERDFIAGDKNLPTFIYSASCCSKSVEIKLTDILENSYVETIDVTVWWNLGPGDILAIVIGTLFCVLLLIIMILLCVRCIKKQQNADLSYTHRYGSRPPA